DAARSRVRARPRHRRRHRLRRPARPRRGQRRARRGAPRPLRPGLLAGDDADPLLLDLPPLDAARRLGGLLRRPAAESDDHAAARPLPRHRECCHHRDYPLTQSTILFVAILFMAINLAVDVLYGYLDPRIRYGE